MQNVLRLLFAGHYIDADRVLHGVEALQTSSGMLTITTSLK